MSLKRKPPSGNVRRTICLGNNFRGVTTNKRGRIVQFESEQEHKLVLLLERDPTVVDFISQPETFHFYDDKGRKRCYTPDFKVWRSDGQIELHEVTIEARREAQKPVPQREIAAQEICKQRGWRYIVHTEKTLPLGYEYVNLEFLAAFRGKSYITEKITGWWMKHLNGLERYYPRAILSLAGSVPANPPELTLNERELLNGLYYLLWHGVIQLEWHQPFLWQGDFHSNARIWHSAKDPIVSLRQEKDVYNKEELL